MNDKWTETDQFLENLLLPEDKTKNQTTARSLEHGLPDIHVSQLQGQLLTILVSSIQAKRVLEIGTLGGYSTICLARGLANEPRKLVTIESNPNHAEVATQSLSEFDFVEVMQGSAIDVLQSLILDEVVPFDFIFIDADKENYSNYLELCLQLSRSGTLIVSDNVVREGEVVNSDSEDTKVQGVREFLENLSKKPNLTSTAIQTVGCKGYDGFSISLVN